MMLLTINIIIVTVITVIVFVIIIFVLFLLLLLYGNSTVHVSQHELNRLNLDSKCRAP